MAKESRYTAATRLAQNDMRRVIESFGEDQPFMSEPVSARTEARRERLASATADVAGLLDKDFPEYFVEKVLDVSERARDARLPANRGMFVPTVRLDPSQVEFRNPYSPYDAGEDARMRRVSKGRVT